MLKIYFPNNLLQQALSLKDELGIDEYAWESATATKLIHALEGSEIVVLGGDVYQEFEGKIRPIYTNWSCDRNKNESLAAYAFISQQKALSFIRSFKEPVNTNIYYVLVLSSEETVGF